MNLNEGLLIYLYGGSVPLYVSVLALVGVVFAAYLLGSINSAITVSRVFFGEDVRTKGSGNAGTTNVLRNYGKKAALFTLLGDMLKTAISILIAGIVFGFGYAAAISVSAPCYLAGLFSVIGHVFPVYYGFRGGKGVLSTATVVLILAPIVAAILIAAFVGIVAFTKFVSLGSVTGCILFPIVLNGYFVVVFDVVAPFVLAMTSVILAILIVWCHRANLARISRGEESKLSFSKKPPEKAVESATEAGGYGDEDDEESKTEAVADDSSAEDGEE